jgi:hypothetical protein
MNGGFIMQLKRDDDDNTTRSPEANYSNEINPNYNNGNGGFNNPNGGMNNNPYGGNVYQDPVQLDDLFKQPDPSEIIRAIDKELSPMTQRIFKIVVVLIVAFGLFFVINNYRKRYEKAEYIPGTYVNNVYKNEFFNIQIALEYGWEIAQIPDDPEMEKNALDDGKEVIEFTAHNAHTIEVLSVMITQTPYNYKDSGTDISKMVEDAKEEFQTMLEQQGYILSNIQKDNAMINGKLLQGYKMTGTLEGVIISCVLYFDFEKNYVAGYAGIGLSEYQAKQTLLDNIKPLN